MARSPRVRRIGNLAEDAGVTVDTLRYYEREGLLPRVDRTAGGFRLYTKETTQRLRFIRMADYKQTQTAVAEIGRMLNGLIISLQPDETSDQ